MKYIRKSVSSKELLSGLSAIGDDLAWLRLLQQAARMQKARQLERVCVQGYNRNYTEFHSFYSQVEN